MNFAENIRLALAGLRASKMRSLLTLLGIIIGIMAVIVIMTISAGIQSSVKDSFGGLGATDMSLYVMPKKDIEEIQKEKGRSSEAGSSQDDEANPESDDASDGEFEPMQAKDYFSVDLIEQMREEFSGRIEGIGMSLPSDSGEAANDRGVTVDVAASASNQDFMIGSLNKQEMVAGRGLEAQDVDNESPVAVVSEKLVKKLFDGDNQNALGKSFEYTAASDETTQLQIIGVYKEFQSQMFNGPSGESEPGFYYPYSLQEQMENYDDYNMYIYQVLVRPAAGIDTKTLRAELQRFCDDLWVDSTYGVMIETFESAMEEINQVFTVLSIGLSGIAGLSLLVGGIGVMNIMLVTVTERTREIGIRKALGASQVSIRLQFLVESMIVCLLGGLLGVILGGVIGYIVSASMQVTAFPPLWAVSFALIFSMGIGVFFGYYPASKAAKLNPIEALRYE